MAITEKQSHIIDARMSKLKEEGFFPPMKRQIPDGVRYLIISYGGTGIRSLLEIKKNLETYIDEVDQNGRKRDDYIRFLAIDTDNQDNQETVYELAQDGSLQPQNREILDSGAKKQFYHLNGANARAAINPPMDRAVESWINPAVVRMVQTNPEYLRGTGASGVRQLGRVSLMSTTTRTELENIVAHHVSDLTIGSDDKLMIMIVSGISGGTGSGTIIDLTYLIRDIVRRQQPAALIDRTRIGGFILLPPTGTSQKPVDVTKGNENGYAALKEINHYMTISEKMPNNPTGNELDVTYQLEYPGGFTVVSNSKLFDVCYLMDGAKAGVAIGAKAGWIAAHVLGDCILDMICSQPVVKTAGNGAAAVTFQAVGSFMNDWHTTKKEMISSKSATDAPRDADYIYSALGHSETLIPINLMKSYVAYELFKAVYERFEKSGDVINDLDKVSSFVTRARKSRTPKVVIDKEINDLFKDPRKGPFYAVNFLKAAAEEVDARLRRGFQLHEEAYQNIGSYIVKQNREIFEIYTAVMMEMKKILEDEYNVAIDGKYVDNKFSFTPVNLAPVESGADAVKKYLDGLVVQKGTTRKLAAELLEDMSDKRQKWTELFAKQGTPGFDPTTAIRQFWNGWLQEIINSTLEDFLIKLSTGDPDAHYDKNAVGDDAKARDKAVSDAAGKIISQMFGSSGPSAIPLADFATHPGLTAADFNPHKYLFVPHTAEHLIAELEAQSDKNFDVVPSYAMDRISCYTQYTSIPAFMLAWTDLAEPNYEYILKAGKPGLHMSETTGGNLWRDFPNLRPESSWRGVNKCQREKSIADMAQDVLNRSRLLGLATSLPAAAGGSYRTYTIEYLPKECRPDEMLYKLLDMETEPARYKEAKDKVDESVETCAAALFNSIDNWKGKSHLDVLQTLAGCGQTMLEPAEAALASGMGSGQRADWDEYVAGTMLRKYPETLLAARGTVDVMEKLKAMVDEVNAREEMLKDFAKYVATGLLKFDAAILSWAYVRVDGIQEAVGPIFTKAELQLAEHYFVFEDFVTKYASIKEALKQQFEDRTTDPDPVKAAQKALALTKAGEAAAKDMQLRINDPANPQQGIGSVSYANKPAIKVYDVGAIRDFYKSLIDEMQIL